MITPPTITQYLTTTWKQNSNIIFPKNLNHNSQTPTTYPNNNQGKLLNNRNTRPFKRSRPISNELIQQLPKTIIILIAEIITIYYHTITLIINLAPHVTNLPITTRSHSERIGNNIIQTTTTIIQTLVPIYTRHLSLFYHILYPGTQSYLVLPYKLDLILPITSLIFPTIPHIISSGLINAHIIYPLWGAITLLYPTVHRHEEATPLTTQDTPLPNNEQRKTTKRAAKEKA
jgi:hypothetical protein